jgi:hypothetical protein
MSHAAFTPPPLSRQPLRVELFLLTHDDDGNPLAHLPSLALGLAGAILIGLTMPDERMPIERVRVVGDAAIGVSPEPSGDPVADWAARFLAGFRPSLTVREAVRQLAGHAHDKVTAGLIAGGYIEPVTRRRLLGRVTTYPATDPGMIHRVRGRLRSVATAYEQPDPQTDALAGLIRALNLESELYLDALGADLRGLLRTMLTRVGRAHPHVERIVTTVEELVGETAVAVYR